MTKSGTGESDLALTIRRAIGGRARRMSTRPRVLAALLLCSLVHRFSKTSTLSDKEVRLLPLEDDRVLVHLLDPQ